MLEHVRGAQRSLLRSPGIGLLVVLTLALGIGANTALFSVLKAVLLDSLPYADPDRIVALYWASSAGERGNHSAANFVDTARHARSLSVLAGWRERSVDLVRADGEPIRLEGAEVTPGFFDVFGVRALRGRPLRSSEDHPGDRRAVVSAPAWWRVFGADESLVGRSLDLGGVQVTVVGVMPEGFAWPPRADVWLLSDLVVPSCPVPTRGNILENRGLRYIDVVGRLAPGVSADTAQHELDALSARLAEADPGNNRDKHLRLVPLQQDITAAVRAPLLLLFAIVTLVLLAAAANVAGLLLARDLGRRREFAIRAALGATPGQLASQILIESLLLALAGGAIGLLGADPLLRLLLHVLPDAVPGAADVRADSGVLLFTAGVSTLTGLLFGLAPARAASRVDVGGELQAGGRAVTGSAGLRRQLVAAQVAVAVGVVAAGGLIVRSLERLSAVESGFAAETVTTIGLPVPEARYPRDKLVSFYLDVVRELEGLGRYPVGAGFPAPFSGDTSTGPLRRKGEPVEAVRSAHLSIVTPGFFAGAGIPVLAGRDFTEADTRSSSPVVVLSHAAAGALFPGREAVGQALEPFSGSSLTVVGVVGDVRSQDLAAEPGFAMYVPVTQFPLPMLNVVARGVAPQVVAGDLRAVVRRLDPALPLGDVRTVAEARSAWLAGPRFRALLISVFGILALALSAVGLYGVLSDSVVRRSREIGVRLALGARASEVVGLVVRDTLAMALPGVAVGLAVALGLGLGLRPVLFAVAPHDPVALGCGLGLVLAGIVVAALVPACRAVRVQPVEALRSE